MLALDCTMPAITQSATDGASLFDVTANNTLIGVNYTAASAANTATISVNSAHSLTMSNNTSLTIGNGGVLTLGSGTVTGNAGASLSLANSGTGLVIGSGGLVSIPTIYLPGANSSDAIQFNGATTGGTIGSPSVVLQNSGETFNVGRGTGAVNLTIGGAISDSGSGYGFTKAGLGVLALTNTANSYSGGVQINAGTLNFANGAMTSGAIAFGGGVLQWAAGNTQDISAGLAAIASGQTAKFDTNGNNVVFNAAVSGSGGLSKQGAGSLVLGNNIYTGATAVNAGTLQLKYPGALQSNISVASGADVDGQRRSRRMNGPPATSTRCSATTHSPAAPVSALTRPTGTSPTAATSPPRLASPSSAPTCSRSPARTPTAAPRRSTAAR